MAEAEEEARRAHSAYVSSGSRELYLSSLSAVFSGDSSSCAPKLSTFLALGLHGQRRLVNFIRQFNFKFRNTKVARADGASRFEVDTRDVCQSFLLEMGLIASDLPAIPASRNLGASNAAAEEIGHSFAFTTPECMSIKTSVAHS